MRSLSTAASGMLAQQLNVEVISNNIANINTIGFKRQRAEFQDLLYQDVSRAGATSNTAGAIVPAGVQVGGGVTAGSVYRINEQGSLNQTGNTFDLAIKGDGWFRIQTPNGDAYTRAGNFLTGPDGLLVTDAGDTVAPGIQIPQDFESVEITPAGDVLIFQTNQANPQNVGTIELARFLNPAGLEAAGGNLFYETAASGPPTIGAPLSNGFGTLEQGWIETANVDSVIEITALIQAQRAYEMNAKVITAADEMMSTANNVR